MSLDLKKFESLSTAEKLKRIKEHGLLAGITPELMAEAVKSGHAPCDDGCIHAFALQEVNRALNAQLLRALDSAQEVGLDPMLTIFNEGLHIGYRLHELITSKGVN